MSLINFNRALADVFAVSRKISLLAVEFGFKSQFYHTHHSVHGSSDLMADKALQATWLEDKEDLIELHYLPLYSPELNATEYVWKELGGKRPTTDFSSH